MKIVNIKTHNIDWNSGSFLYIGRENKFYGVKESIFKNPYVIGRDGERSEVIRKFAQYAIKNKQIMDNLHLIDGKTLVCYCDIDKEACHGQILIELRERQKQ